MRPSTGPIYRAIFDAGVKIISNRSLCEVESCNEISEKGVPGKAVGDLTFFTQSIVNKHKKGPTSR